jgi:nucleolar protein 16
MPRFLSEGEAGYLRRLVGRHGEDIEAMARDRKLNPDQRTVGELTRLMKKAGGFENVGRL